MLFAGNKAKLPDVADALPGRAAALPLPDRHFVNGHPLKPPFPEGMAQAVFGLGCFWGAEQKFNYHRPCFFPVTKTNAKGKQVKTYPYKAMMTPYEKFKSLDQPSQHLKPDITMNKLDAIAFSINDNDAAKQLKDAKQQLFKTVTEQNHQAAGSLMGCILPRWAMLAAIRLTRPTGKCAVA